MKICIDARGANMYSGTGIGTYTDNLVRNILSIDKTNEYMLFWCGENYESLKDKNSKIILTGEKNNSFWLKSYIPTLVNNSDVNIFHVTQNGIDMPDICNKTKIVTTIHDLIPYTLPETVGKGYKKKFLSQMPFILDRSDAIITVSHYSKKDILKYFDLDPEKIFVTHLATDKIFRPMNISFCKTFIKEKYNINDDFILYLGGFSERKNVAGVIKAYAKVKKDLQNTKLTIIGSPREEYKVLNDLITKYKLENDVIFTGFVPLNELPIFYNAALTFVYPSFYEGFGLPPLECMSCGTPVITSNTTSIPEIVKGCAITINPSDIDDLAAAIFEVLTDSDLYNMLTLNGLNRAKQFSWKSTAENTIEVYKNIFQG